MADIYVTLTGSEGKTVAGPYDWVSVEMDDCIGNFDDGTTERVAEQLSGESRWFREGKTYTDMAITKGQRQDQPRSPWVTAQEIHAEFRKELGKPVLGRAVNRLLDECPGMFASAAEATSFMLTFTLKPRDPSVILKLYRLTTQRKEDRIACTDWLASEFHSAFDTIDEAHAYLDHGKL